MTTDTLVASTNTPISGIPFGTRLQSAREALGLDSKDAAAQLRLNERIILMLETDCYASDLPATFVRGYIRAYGKLLQIPEEEIKQAIAPIKPQTSAQPLAPKIDDAPKVTSSHYFMQLLTYLVIFTLLGLVGMWWYSHSNTSSPVLSQNTISVPEEAAATKPLASNMTVKSEAVSGTVTLGAKMPEVLPPMAAGATSTETQTATTTVASNTTASKTKAPVVTPSADNDDEDDNTD